MASKNKKRSKLLYIVFGLLLITFGLLAYKYLYIFNMKNQLSPVTEDFKQLQSDLKAAGVETEYAETCGKDQGKNGTGARHCGVSLSYLKPMDVNLALKEANIILKQANSMGLVAKDSEVTFEQEFNDFEPDDIILIHNYNAEIQCSFVYQNINSIDNELPINVNFELYCGRNVRFTV